MKACSCVLVPIVLFCLFLGVIVLFIFNTKDISIKLDSNTKSASSSTEVKSVLGKIDTKAIDGKSWIVLTEDDINVLISEYLKDILTSPETKIYTDRISITGTLEDLFGAKAVLTINPSVNNEKLVMKISTIKIGFLNAPDFIKEQISSQINKNIEQKINSEGLISNLILENGKMTIILKELEK